MVTKLNSVEFKNCWNAMVNCEEFDPAFINTHFGVGVSFTHEEIESNKPDGWRKLTEIINDIEQRCVVYYYCQQYDGYHDYEKTIYFIVFGENINDEISKISKQFEVMKKMPVDSIDIARRQKGTGTGNLTDVVAAQCPLFD